MNSFREFDYRKLANRDQSGRNQSDYGASPFIIKHFGSPEAVRFVPKSERTKEEHVEGETEEQKAARLNAKAEELAQLAKDLLAKSEAKNKVKGFLKGKILVKRAKEVLGQKKVERTQAEIRKAEEIKARQRGLKGIVRRLVRTKKTIKEQAKALKLPKWWNGIMAIIGAAKELKMDSGNESVWEYCKTYHNWLGSVLFYLNHKSTNNKYFIDIASLPPKVEAPKNWTKAKPEVKEAYNAYVSAYRDVSEGVEEAMIRVFSLWLQWVFKVAMPQKGWKFIEYKPREEDFPPDIMEKAYWAADEAAKKKAGVGEVPSYLRVSLGGTPQPKHDYSERSKVVLGPLPETIPLLVEPEGRFAYLISGRTSNGMDELVDWEKLAKGIISNPHSGNFSLSTKFRKMGTHWEYINHRYDPEKNNPKAMRPTYIPIPAGDKIFKDPNDWTLLGSNPSPDSKDSSGSTRHISSAYPEGITQIIEPYFNELCSRKEWDGIPLTKTDLTGSGRKRR
jgi:hypothetical protein